MTEQEELHMQLFEAVERGDLSALKTLLLNVVEPGKSTPNYNIILHDIYVLNDRCTRKPTLLIVASAFSQLAIVQFLLTQGANPNIPDKRQRYPLHFAAMKGDIDVLRTLIAAKAEVNKQDWDNCAPLHFCASNGFVAGAEALLDAGAAINIQDRLKETPLIIAITDQQVDMVAFLIKSRADVHKPALHKKTPLFYAKDAAIAKLLIEAGADVKQIDEIGFTPLHQSVVEQHFDVAKVLIELGADVNAQDNQKQTPLHLAAAMGQKEICELLLEHGADLKILDIARRSPEMLARREDRHEVVQLILKYHPSAEDEDAPLLAFKPFSGIKQVSNPPKDENTDQTVKKEDFKFDIHDQ